MKMRKLFPPTQIDRILEEISQKESSIRFNNTLDKSTDRI